MYIQGLPWFQRPWEPIYLIILKGIIMNDEKSILPEELNRGLRKSCERFCAEIQMK